MESDAIYNSHLNTESPAETVGDPYHDVGCYRSYHGHRLCLHCNKEGIVLNLGPSKTHARLTACLCQNVE